MFRIDFSKAALLAILAVGSIATASAQLREFSAGGDGRGSWDLKPRWDNADLRQVDVVLQKSGRFEIRLKRGVDLVITGAWSNANDQRCLLRVEGVGRDAGYGSGTLDHDRRGNLTRVHLTGSVERSRFTLDFSTVPGENKGGDSYHPGNGQGSLRTLFSTQDGRGFLSFRGRASENEVRKLSVNLRRDGTAEIRMLSGSNETIQGRWTNMGSRSVKINVDKIGRDRAYGDGTVEHDGRGNFNRITLNGSVGGTPFDLQFSAGRQGGGWNGNGNGNGNGGDFSREERQFLDAARQAIQDKFPSNTRFDWYGETVSGTVLGNRTVKGQFRVFGREEYNYTVTLGAGTASVKSSSYSRN